MYAKITSRLSIEIDAEQDTTEKLLSTPENKKRLLDAIDTSTKDRLIFKTMEDLKDALGV